MSLNYDVESKICNKQVVETKKQSKPDSEETIKNKPMDGMSVNANIISHNTEPKYDASAFQCNEHRNNESEEEWVTLKQIWNRSVESERQALLPTNIDYFMQENDRKSKYVHKSTQTFHRFTLAKYTQTDTVTTPVIEALHDARKTDAVAEEFLSKTTKRKRDFEDNIMTNIFKIYHKKTKVVLSLSGRENVPISTKPTAIMPVALSQSKEFVFIIDTHPNVGAHKWSFIKESTVFAPQATADSDILLFMLKAQRKHIKRSSKQNEESDSDSSSLDDYETPTSPEGFWDLMASPTVQKAAPHCVFISSVVADQHGVLINGRMYLGEYNWHTMVPAALPEGWHARYGCAVCAAEVRGRDAVDHMRLDSHRRRLAGTVPLDKYGENVIRRITEQTFHCAVCNKIVPNVSKHVLEDMHKLQYDMAIESAHIYLKKKMSDNYSEANIATETNEPIETDSETEEETDSGTDNSTDDEFDNGLNSESDSESNNETDYDSAQNISNTSISETVPIVSAIDPACKFIIDMPAVTTADLEIANHVAFDSIDHLKDINYVKEPSCDKHNAVEEHVNRKESSVAEECNLDNENYSKQSSDGDEYNSEDENISDDYNGNDTVSTQMMIDSEQDVSNKNTVEVLELTNEELDLGLWPDLQTNNLPEENNDIESMESPNKFSYAQMASKKAQPVILKLPPVVNKPQPSVNQHPSGNLEKANQECMVVTVGSNKYILNSDHFHTLLPNKETWYCMACKKNCSLYKNTHKFSEEHCKNIMLMENFGENMIRQLDFKFYHCVACNRLIFHYELDKHTNEREHRGLTQHIVNRSTPGQIELQEQMDLDMMRAVERSITQMKATREPEIVPDGLKSVGTILLNVYGAELRIDRYAWQGIVCCSEDCYRCILCGEVLQTAMIEDHLKKPNHISKLHKISFSAEYGEHLLRQVDQVWVHCAVCNKNITSGAEHIGVHIRGASHNNKLHHAKMSAANRTQTPNGTTPAKPPDSPIARENNGTNKLQQLLLGVPESMKAKQPTTYYYSPGKITQSPANNIAAKKAQQENSNAIASKMQELPIKCRNRMRSTDSETVETQSNPESITEITSVSKAQKVKNEKKVHPVKANREPAVPLKEYLITFCGRKVVLGANAWHGVRECLNGTVRCYLCGMSFEGDVNGHLGSLGHRIAIAATKLMDEFPEHFIRELTPSLANCTICNNVLPPGDVEKHIVNPKHRKGLLAVTWDKYHERTVADTEAINLDEEINAVEESAKRCCIVYSADWPLSVVVSARAWHGLYAARDGLKCFVCAASVEEAGAAAHAASAEHVAGVRACQLLDAYPGHFVRKMPRGQVHCVTCHALVQTKDVDCHVLKENHETSLQRARVVESRLAELRSAEVVYFSEYSSPREIPEREKNAENNQAVTKDPAESKKPIRSVDTESNHSGSGKPNTEETDHSESGSNSDLQSIKTRKESYVEPKSEQEQAKLARANIDATVKQAKLSRRREKAVRHESDFADKINDLRACMLWCRQIVLSSDNWNDLRVGGGRFYCMLCSEGGPVGGAEEHTRAVQHRVLMRRTPFQSSDSPFIRLERPDGYLLCVMCQLPVAPRELERHSRDERHTRLRVTMARALNEQMYFPGPDSE